MFLSESSARKENNVMFKNDLQVISFFSPYIHCDVFNKYSTLNCCKIVKKIDLHDKQTEQGIAVCQKITAYEFFRNGSFPLWIFPFWIFPFTPFSVLAFSVIDFSEMGPTQKIKDGPERLVPDPLRRSLSSIQTPSLL